MVKNVLDIIRPHISMNEKIFSRFIALRGGGMDIFWNYTMKRKWKLSPLSHFFIFIFFFCPFILRAAPNYLNAWNRLRTGYFSFNVQAKLNLVSFAAVIRGTLRDDPNNGCVGD